MVDRMLIFFLDWMTNLTGDFSINGPKEANNRLIAREFLGPWTFFLAAGKTDSHFAET